jgi:hypothetical protein
LSKHDLVKDRERLERAIHDTKAIMDGIDVAVDRVEAARGQISVLGDEIRNQQTISRARLAWLIAEVDRIREDMAKLKENGP